MAVEDPERAAATAPADAETPNEYGLAPADYAGLDEGNRDLLRTASRQGSLAPVRSRSLSRAAHSRPAAPRASSTTATATASGAQAQGAAKEAGPDLALRPFPSQQEQDQIVIHWEGPNDPENPLNWSFGYKYVLALPPHPLPAIAQTDVPDRDGPN